MVNADKLLILREHRSYRQQIAQRSTFLIAELLTILGRIQHLVLLLRRQRAELAEAAGHGTAPIVWQRTQLPHCTSDLRALLRRQALHGLTTLDNLLPLRCRHTIQSIQALHHPLLRLLRKLIKPRLFLQSPLLLLRTHVLVLLHPLVQMFTTWPLRPHHDTLTRLPCKAIAAGTTADLLLSTRLRHPPGSPPIHAIRTATVV